MATWDRDADWRHRGRRALVGQPPQLRPQLFQPTLAILDLLDQIDCVLAAQAGGRSRLEHRQGAPQALDLIRPVHMRVNEQVFDGASGPAPPGSGAAASAFLSPLVH
jgi:hypothetical protein